jgi:hypothetical protein
VSIAPGMIQEVELPDPLNEVLNVEEFIGLLHQDTFDKILTELEKLYSDVRKCDYPILPQFLAIVYMKLSKIKYLSALYRKLSADDCKLAEKLGFERENGEVKLPSYNNFWVFTKIRFVGEKIDDISEMILSELKGHLHLRGIELGKNTAHDDFVIRSHDKEATYNGHYGTTMYKGEAGFDLDIMVPIYGCATTGTDYDGNYVVPFAEKLDKIEKDGRRIYLDGHYTSLANFAVLNQVHKVRTVMNIPQDQRVISEEGSLENIDKWYQSFHEKEDFTVNADTEYKLSLLLKYGRVDEVGYYYRNRYVQEYLDNPEKYDKGYHKRSLEESGNNLMKNGLVDTENASNGTGLRNRNLHLKLCLLAMQLVALIRAQHGRVAKLTSIENIAC